MRTMTKTNTHLPLFSFSQSRAMDRLAAAHRGAVRAMQVFTNQLSDTSEGRMPSYYKELGQLIRQLSLCSAKVEVGQGSAVPETALDILLKLEVSHRLSPKWLLIFICNAVLLTRGRGQSSLVLCNALYSK